MQNYKLFNLYTIITRKGGLMQKPLGLKNNVVLVEYAMELEKICKPLLDRIQVFNTTESNFNTNKQLTAEATKTYLDKMNEDVEFTLPKPEFHEIEEKQLWRVLTPEEVNAFYQVYEA